MEKLAPNSIYDKKRARKMRKRKLMMKVPKLFRSIWQNCDKIFCQAPVPGPAKASPVRTPTIEWSKVNQRAISNLPIPQGYPVLGCSQDPKFYESKEWCSSNYPFGSKKGFLTNLGVVDVPGANDVVHGYVYDNYWGWILHAGYAEQREETNASTRATVKSFRWAERRQHTSQKKRKFG